MKTLISDFKPVIATYALLIAGMAALIADTPNFMAALKAAI